MNTDAVMCIALTSMSLADAAPSQDFLDWAVILTNPSAGTLKVRYSVCDFMIDCCVVKLQNIQCRCIPTARILYRPTEHSGIGAAIPSDKLDNFRCLPRLRAICLFSRAPSFRSGARPSVCLAAPRVCGPALVICLFSRAPKEAAVFTFAELAAGRFVIRFWTEEVFCRGDAHEPQSQKRQLAGRR